MSIGASRDLWYWRANPVLAKPEVPADDDWRVRDPFIRPKAGELYICFDDTPLLDWRKTDVERVLKMWKKGYPLQKMARVMKESNLRVWLLLMSLDVEGRLLGRNGGYMGIEAEKREG